MVRRIATFTVGVVCFAMVGLASAANVTYVLNNGERHSGTLVYHKDANLGLIENGQERSYPISGVAAIIYNDGDPSSSELSQLPTSDNPPELERHTLVMRDGRVVRGKVYHWDPDSVIFDSLAGRGTYNAGDIARLYLSGPPARSVFSNAPANQNVSRGRRGELNNGNMGDPQMTVRVPANQAWTDTGILVRAGERIAFAASGTVQFGKDMSTGPEGNKDVARPGYQLQSMGPGGLIGRVGNGAPFAIGAMTTAIPMPAAGRLFIGVNDDGFTDNSGAFDVAIYRR